MATYEEVQAQNNDNIRRGFDNLAGSIPSGGQRAMYAYRNAQMQQLMQGMQYKSKINQLFQNLYQRDGQGNIVRDQNGLPVQDPNVVSQLSGVLGAVDPSTVPASLQRAPGVYSKGDIEANTLQHQSPETLAALFGPQPKTYNPSTGETMVVPPNAKGVYSPGQSTSPSPNAALQSRTELNKPTIFNPSEGQQMVVPPGSPIGGDPSQGQAGPTMLGGGNPKKIEELQGDLAKLFANDALLKRNLQNSDIAAKENPYQREGLWGYIQNLNPLANHFADASEKTKTSEGDPGAAARQDRLNAIFPELGQNAKDITNRTTEKEIDMIRPGLPQQEAGAPIWNAYYKKGLAQNQVDENLLQQTINNGGMQPALPDGAVHGLLTKAFQQYGLNPVGSDPALYGNTAQPATPDPTQPTAAPVQSAPANQLPPPEKRQLGMAHPRNSAYQWGKDDSGNMGWVPASATPTQTAQSSPVPGTDAAASTAPTLPTP